MTHFQIKLIALITMFIDHFAMVFGYYGVGLFSSKTTYLLRSIGRIAFPIFAFNISNGLEKTKSREKYLERLVLFAFISEIPFVLMHYGGDSIMQNFTSFFEIFSNLKFNLSLEPLEILALISTNILVFYFFQYKNKKFCLFYLLASSLSIISLYSLPYRVYILDPTKLNVFYTLFTGAFVSYILDSIILRFKKFDGKKLIEIVLLAIMAGLTIFVFTKNSDYGYKGVLLIFLLYVFKKIKFLQLITLTCWLYFTYYYPIPMGEEISLLFVFSLVSVLVAFLYNGKKGYNNKVFRIFTYIFYPLHISLLLYFPSFINWG